MSETEHAEEFDSPCEWFRDHKVVQRSASGSGFDVLVDTNRDAPILRHGSHCGKVRPETLLEELDPDALQDALESAGVLEDAEEDEAESRSPEDVAGEWARLTDGDGQTRYMPNDRGMSVEHLPDGYKSTLKYEHDVVMTESGTQDGPRSWWTSEYERIDAADLPFSEVPADE